MPESLSFLGLLASGLYALVVLACVAGTTTAIGKRQPSWHRNVWIVLAVLFVALILMRGLGIEDWLRAALREELRSEGEYEGRRDLQSLIVAGVLALVGVIGGWWFFRASRAIRGRRNIAAIAALACGAVMVLLVALRMISLHAVDRLLYGPTKLNWIVDVGASVAVLGLALYYVKLVRARP